MELGLVALWLVTYLALLLAGMPITRALVPHLDDRGAGIALPLSMAVLWLVAYFVGFVSIRAGLVLGLTALVAVSALLYRRGHDIETGYYVETGVVFTVAFLFLVVIRAFDPAVSAPGGEKFLDMGLLQSLLRSSTIPPEDMWFAGETVRYYYGGHYLSSLLARLTGTEARFAYNLALAGFYAMLVTGVYGLAGSIAADRGFSRRRASVLGAFFVGFASNLYAPAQFVLGRLPDAVADPIVAALGVEIRGIGNSLAEFSYWPSSRIIENTINEFPLFAWLNGDLHAHMMSTMVLVLVVGVLADVWMAGDRYSRQRTLIALLGVIPPLGAMITLFNTWSFPAVGGLVALTVLFGSHSPAALVSPRLGAWERSRGSLQREGLRIVLSVVFGGLALALAYLWAAPYWLWTASSQSSVGFLPPRSALGPLLIVHGAFLVLFWLYVHRHTVGVIRDQSVAVGSRELGTGSYPTVVVFGLSLALVAVSILADAPAVGLFGPLILLGWLLLRWRTPTANGVTDIEEATVPDATPASDGGQSTPRPGFETVLIVAAAGLVVMTEFFHVAEPLAPTRFNTVFKVYAQVWVLAAIAAGVVLTRLVAERAPSLGFTGPKWRYAMAGVGLLLVASTAIYGGLAMSDHVQSDFNRDADDLTLDALQFVEEDHTNEAPAIEWLLYEVEGQPNMAEYPNDLGYTWANAPSSLTGVPAIAGWWPARGYHGPERYDQRKADAKAIFNANPGKQRFLLDWYDVELIYVGPVERNNLGTITVSELDAVEVEKQFDAVTIYRVDQSELDAVEE